MWAFSKYLHFGENDIFAPKSEVLKIYGRQIKKPISVSEMCCSSILWRVINHDVFLE